MKCALYVALVLFCALSNAQTKSRRYIDALVAIPNLGSEVYYDDGVGDGSILRYGERDNDHKLKAALPEVHDIVSLKEQSIPLLIECLDDTRLTSIEFHPANHADPAYKGELVQVPVSFVCLDILSETVQPHRELFIPDCDFDGMGACYQDGYYFRPELLVARGEKDGVAEMRKVKAKWAAAFKKRWLHWKYPEIWRAELSSAPKSPK